MGVSLSTVLEMFTHPEDLYFAIGTPGEKTKFAILVTRGPGHNYKPLLSTNATFEDRAEALAAMTEVLEATLKEGALAASTPGRWYAMMFNPENRPIEEFSVLKREKVEAILKALQTHEQVESWHIPG